MITQKSRLLKPSVFTRIHPTPLLITHAGLPKTWWSLPCCHSNPVERAGRFSGQGVIYRGVGLGFLSPTQGIT